MKAQQQGFTLIELMITLAVAAILLAIAAPSFRTMIINHEAQAQSEQLLSALQLARSEAVKRSRPVSICPTNSSEDDCGSDWSEGYLVVVDGADSGSTSVTVDEVLGVFDVSNDDAQISADEDFLRYLGTGMMAQVGGSNSVTFTSYVSGCEGDHQREMRIGIAGTISSSRKACPGS